MICNFLKVLLTLAVIIITNYHSYGFNDYPKTKEEQEMEELESFTNLESVRFKTSKVRSQSTNSVLNLNINKYLWQASLQLIHFMPLVSVDSNSGVIITDWYIPESINDFCSFKLHIFVKGDTINPTALEVKIFEKLILNNNKQVIKQNKSYNLVLIIEEIILKRARELYLLDKDKKK